MSEKDKINKLQQLAKKLESYGDHDESIIADQTESDMFEGMYRKIIGKGPKDITEDKLRNFLENQDIEYEKTAAHFEICEDEMELDVEVSTAGHKNHASMQVASPFTTSSRMIKDYWAVKDCLESAKNSVDDWRRAVERSEELEELIREECPNFEYEFECFMYITEGNKIERTDYLQVAFDLPLTADMYVDWDLESASSNVMDGTTGFGLKDVTPKEALKNIRKQVARKAKKYLDPLGADGLSEVMRRLV